MAELDGKRLQNLDEILRQMNKTLATMETTLKDVGVAMTTAFGSSTQQMVKNVQQAFRGAQLSDMLGIDQAKLGISDLQKEIKLLEGNVDSHTLGTVTWNNKSSKWKYSAGKTKMTDEQEYAAREKLVVLNEKLKYSMMSQDELMMKIASTAGKMNDEVTKQQENEKKGLSDLIKLRDQYEVKMRNAQQNATTLEKTGSKSKSVQDQISFWQKQASDYEQLMKSTNDRVNEARNKGIALSLEEETKLRLAQAERIYKIENNKQGYASKEWKAETSQRTKRNAELDKRADEYRQSIEKLTQAEVELAKAEENLRQKQEGRNSKGLPFAESTIRGAAKAVQEAKNKITEAEDATKRFGAALTSLKGGTQRFNAIREAFGLGKEAEQDMQKIPTAFERVIAQINQRAQQQKGTFAKRLFDAEAIRDEYKKTAASLVPEITRLRKIINQSEQPAYNWAKYVDDSAIKRYKAALLEIEKIQQRINTLNDPKLSKYDAHIRAVEGVTRRYNDNEQAIAKLQQRWEELNVKKQAGLVNQKDFDAQTQKILDEYDRLIAKRKEFEIGDLGQMSSQRQNEREQEEERLAQLRKSNTQARLDDEMRAEKMIKAERAKREAKENKAIRQQVTNYKQLSALLKQYNSLKQVKGRTQEEEAALERTRQKIKEIIAEMRKLDKEQSGSLGKAMDITEYDRLLAKDKEITREKEKQNNQTKRQKANLERLLPILQRIASAFGIAFSVRALAQFGKKLIETRGEFEIQQVALRSILQNKQLADEIWDKTMQAALRSPFTAMQLTRYTKQLAAYRIETDKLFDTTKRLADISAGLGVDMQRLILAYGQVKAANYLRASEIRQFTEAGVNILGELSRYFSETRNQMYSTAQVMEMVTKRMVKFEDVEAIFKRMTDQGGIFYNMQYVQSQTVRGQIAKLHDAYDQMLNSIGKANQGALRTFVGLLNNIVKNWREWKTAIDLIMWPLLISSVYKFGRGLFYANAAAIVTNKNVNALTRSGARLNLALKKLFATISAHPIGAIITVAAAATLAFWNHWKAVKAINNEYDEMNGRMLETQYRMTSYQEKIEKNNAILKDSKKSTKEHNEAQDENKKILSELQRDYPEVASGMTIANNGIIAMTNSMKEYNAQLRLQILLNERAKGSFWNKSLKKDLEGFDEEISKQQTKLAQYTNQAQRVASELQNAIESGKVSDADFSEALKSLMQMAAATSIEEYEKALEKYQSTKVKGDWASSALERELSGIFGGSRYYFKTIAQSGALKSSRKKVMEEIKGDYEYFGSYIREMALLSEDFTGKFALTAEEFINGNQGILQSMLYTVKEDGTLVMGELGYALSQAFADAASGAQTEQAAQEMIDEWIRQIKEKYGLDVKFGLKQKKEEPTYDPAAEEKLLSEWRQRIKLIEDMNKKYKELSKSVYGYAKSEQKVREAFQNAWKEANMPFSMESIDFTSDKAVADALAMFRGKIPQKLLSELEKTISERESTIELDVQVRIREDFGKQMEKAFGDYELTVELGKLNLPKGLANELWGVEKTDLSDLRAEMTDMFNRLKDENGQLADDAFKKYENFIKRIDDLETKQQRERLKDYSKYIEAQYSDRVKLEMEYVRKLARLEAMSMDESVKSDIRKGLEKDFLEKSRKQDWEDFKGSEFYVQMMEDLEKQSTASLEVMRVKLLDMRKNAENLSPRALKEVVNALEKIDNLERTRNKPLSRLKSALKELEGNDMKDVFGSLAEKQKRLAQYEEEEKGLERMIMLENERLRLEKEKVSLDEAKQRLASSNKAVKAAEKALREFRSTGSKEDTAMVQQLTETLNNAKMVASMWQIAVEALSGESVIGSQKGSGAFYGWSLSDLKTRRDELKKQKSELQGQIDKEEQLVEINKELQLAWHATWEAVKDWGGRVQNIFDGVMDSIDYFEGSALSMTSEWKEFGDTMVSSMNDLVGGIQAYQVANEAARKADLATGLFTANGLKLAMVILGVIIKIVQAIAKMHDARIDKEIEQSKERVDDLQKAYDRLEKSIEKTFDTVSYIREYNQEVQNLNEQIEEANNQIAAAQDYKSEDKKREAIEAAEDAKQQALDALDEIKQAQIEVFGGIGADNYRSAAEGFVDAWKSAFLETGDGLQGLQDHFDEFLNDWFVKQATMKIAAGNLEPLFRKIDDAVDQYGLGGTDVIPQELQEINDLKDLLLTRTNEQLKELAGVFGLGGEGSLSGLAAGIQGMTEEQANILEAYWDSVRAYTASIDVNVARIADILGAGGRSTNPQIQYLESIASNTIAIREMLSSALTNEGNGRGFRSYPL